MFPGMDNRRQASQPTDRDRADEEAPKRAGDILGLSDADPSVSIPQATTDRSPANLSDEPATASVTQLRPTRGATGIDMGAGGNGTDIEPARIRRSDPTA